MCRKVAIVNSDLREYAIAARRKLLIAHYHLGMLTDPVLVKDDGSAVLVATQAHFEGVLYAFIAAGDQVAELLNLGFNLGLGHANLWGIIKVMPDSALRDRLSTWQETPIAVDARGLRRRATHHHYRKTPLGSRLEAQEIQGSPYQGSRILDEYAQAVVAHLDAFAPLIKESEGLFQS
jgi:hypothetical protein